MVAIDFSSHDLESSDSDCRMVGLAFFTVLPPSVNSTSTVSPFLAWISASFIRSFSSLLCRLSARSYTRWYSTTMPTQTLFLMKASPCRVDWNPTSSLVFCNDTRSDMTLPDTMGAKFPNTANRG